MTQISRAVRALAVFTLLAGLVYPVVVLVGAQAMFGHQADGSLIVQDGHVIGSELVGQSWAGEQWFYGRPSATGYDAAASAGSNLGPLSTDLAAAISDRAEAITEVEAPYRDIEIADIPVDLLTSSASGLDPHISVAAARLQAARIAEVQGVSEDTILTLIEDHIEARTLGVWGQERVNVLELNLAVERLART